MHQLNQEQLNVKQAIQAMQARGRLVISGRAGSGKTYAIANSVADRKALFLAPTHPARTVLEQEMPDKRHSVMTIHSAIGWFQRRNEELDLVEGYLPAKKAKNLLYCPTDHKLGIFADIDIIIVDEFSMVGSFLFRAIEDYANEFNLPVVYSGDCFQLPPVKDQEVIMDQGFETITMEGSLRFSCDSEIYQVGEMLRDMIEQRPNDEIPCLYSGTSVQVMLGDKWIDSLTSGYANCDSLLAVTSDNKTLKRLRGKVRQVDHDRLTAGDLVISKQTDEQFRNGEQFTISRIVPDKRVLLNVPECVSQFGDLTVHGFTITFLETARTAFVLEYERDADKLSDRIRDQYREAHLDHSDAVRVMDWVDQIQRFELSALATIHKSQGRSVDTVFIDTNTVLIRPSWLSPKEHKRLLYTAVTRARKRVVFYEMHSICEAEQPKPDEAALVSLQQDLVDA